MTRTRRLRYLFAVALGALAVFGALWLAPPAALAALEPGSSAVVRADGDCLRLRAQPSLQGTLITCIPDGSIVTVLGGSVAVEGYQWQRISYAGQTGWSVDLYLRPTTAAPTAPTSAPTAAPPAASTPLPTPALTGNLPATGGFGLAVWGGGPIDRIPPLAADRGCALRAVWVTSGGDFVGYVYGAPSVVNATWNGLYPDGSLAANSAIIVVCAAASAPPSAPPPSASPPSSPPPGAAPVATPGVPPGVPNLPPGPAGNG